ncbi:hypothetical protein JCM9140_1160 [Halalkalibacter wakoensis JCM 9140]|uniref:HTH merR-type domain-containing protein n=1 Tax=Halalkalibacter wakoensis JCM 9140 TaxID=1236970 RepID=W4PZB4_9BACI|nr:methyltransferase domain-containing protein [Halalkalibacter wakoensis]GAE25181.1 hypothetical protein JCM9140_1160 [Halalkalibacter wakoensis JCM 9140]
MKNLKIKEMAEKLGITSRAIRFYEEKGLISPQKHPTNLYRTFSEADAKRLQAIISLREIDIPIDEIKQILEDLDLGGKDDLLYSLELQRSLMFAQILELKESIATTDEMIEALRNKQGIKWDRLFELTKDLRRQKNARASWQDLWNFDDRASFHDELVLEKHSPFDKHSNYEHTLQQMVDWVRADQHELGIDLGTGTGNLAGHFLKKGVQMAGVDQSKEMLKQCQSKYPEYETKLGNFLAIPYADRQFDFLVTSYALHHVTNEQKTLVFKEMQRVLKPHGRICIADVMFEHEEKRQEYLRRLKQTKQEQVRKEIEKEHYADLSKLLIWFDDHGYVTKVQQMSELVYIVYAVPIKISS